MRGSPVLDGPAGVSADLGGARANGRARLASQAQLSGPQESVTALRKLRMGTPGLRAGQPGIWPDGWCVKAGLIECDLALAVCAKLLTIEIFFTGNRPLSVFKQSAGRAARSGMRSSPGCARVPKIPAGPIFRPSWDIERVSPGAAYHRPQRRAFYPPVRHAN